MFHLFRKLHSKQRHFSAVASKYGYEEVPAATIYATFEEVSGVGELGFATVRPGFYARQAGDDVTHVVKLQRLKGGSLAPWWGVSLAYLPHLQGDGLRRHRTLKSARLDLFEEPFDYFQLYDLEWPDGTEYFAQHLHGPVYLRETLERMWSALAERIAEWQASVEDAEGVLRRAGEQLDRDWRSIGHNPDPRLVHAFTLARLGRPAEAKASLAVYRRQPGVEAEEADLFERALSATERGG